MPQKLRTDAQDNRDRIVTAARDLFAEHGLKVSMRDVARRAYVGPATLYRRFPTKQDLLEEIFSEEMHACRSIVERGYADPDPSRGFTTSMTGLIMLNAHHRGFVEAFLASTPHLDFLAEHRKDLLAQLATLADRAKAAGSVRQDLTSADLTLLLLASRGISSLSADKVDHAARRLSALALDALRPTSRAKTYS
ncbi:TetR/AcrR family transcriptional regulator [Microbacterium marinilacus]|nr:TetR/AcrR family transcriptional regulator [Microbacterium marinilacus]